jgi:hypothetical protein
VDDRVQRRGPVQGGYRVSCGRWLAYSELADKNDVRLTNIYWRFINPAVLGYIIVTRERRDPWII